jgi:hypothetical protein
MSTTASASRSLAALAAAYADDRTPEALTRLRHAVRSTPGYRADLDVRSAAAPLLDRGGYAEVLDLVQGLMPGAFFSPSAHAALAAAHEGLGDAVRARRERRTARLAMDSILATGDGSAAMPWSVLRISDEYDVLDARARTSVEQRLVTRAGRPLDHHRCDDGSEAWFDVSSFVPAGPGSTA